MGGAEGIVGEYEALLCEADADLLAMQVGDFYEFFGEAAHRVHDALGLQLSEKPSGGERYPMAGVPVAEIDRYVAALVDRGYRVAIADQREGPEGIERAVERVVTPGTTLEGEASGHLVALAQEDGRLGVAAIDARGGRARVDRAHAVTDAEDVVEVLESLDLAEVLLGPSVAGHERLEERLDVPVVAGDPDAFGRRGVERVHEHFGEEVGAALGLAGVTVAALGGALGYLERTDASALATVSRLERYRGADAVALDATTLRNLEVLETFHGERDGSLLGVLDHTTTAAGRRHLGEWLRRPTRDVDVLEHRLDAVEALVGAPLARDAIAEALAGTYDLARVATRVARGSAGPRDLGRARDTLRAVPAVRTAVDGDPDLVDSAVDEWLAGAEHGPIPDLASELDAALVDDPPPTASAGGLIRRGYDDALDEAIERHETLEAWFEELPEREAAAHGFDAVELGRTQTAGHFLQLPAAELDRVPDHYDRIGTVSAGVRFRTDELGERERELAAATERRVAMETAAFEALCDEVADAREALAAAGRALAGLDVRLALATHAAANGWTRPAFRDDGVIAIDRGRHPVVEQTTRFVPNDVRFDERRAIHLVTGPNMSGKSTYLRQVALIVLLAQVGSFVPAERAAVSPVDGIFTRVGALDELAEGRSTFMVEMQELARILHHASADSLVVLDEVGRGTATYDGLSLAWAATEFLHNRVRTKALFATHYHELTALADHLEGVCNRHVAVEETDDDVVFLREVRPGASDRSYGIHVADMAGVPAPVVDRATAVLERIREERALEARGRDRGTTQVVFDLDAGDLRTADDPAIGPDAEAILEAIESLDLARERPIDLLERIRDWQRRLDGA
ncbi:MAG: DNA mismatch repair protein MutS [Halobacteriales archaeon]